MTSAITKIARKVFNKQRPPYINSSLQDAEAENQQMVKELEFLTRLAEELEAGWNVSYPNETI